MPSTKSDTGLPPRRTVRYIRTDIANKINWQPHPIEPCYVEQERRISNKNFGIYIINQSGQGGVIENSKVTAARQFCDGPRREIYMPLRSHERM